MHTQLAGKSLAYMVSAVALILAGLFTASIELLMLATPLVFLLLPLAFEATAREPDYEIAVRFEGDRCFEGDYTTAHVSITAVSAVFLIDLHVLLRDAESNILCSRHITDSLKPGETAAHNFELHMPVRGVFSIGCVGRTYSRSGLKCFGDKSLANAELIVYPRPTPVGINWSLQARSRQHMGESASRMAGDGLEVSDIRLHMPGDPVRRVNWRATLRHGALYINDSVRDRNIDVVIVVDGLEDIGDAPDRYIDHACRAAAGIAMGFLRNHDRVGIIRCSGIVDWVAPRSGRNHLYAILDSLARVHPFESFVSPNMRFIPRAALPTGSMVLVITPLLDDRSMDIIAALASRRCYPMVVYMSPKNMMSDSNTNAERYTTLLSESDAHSLALRWWRLKHQARLNKLRSMGIMVAEWDGSGSLSACLNRYFGAPGYHSAQGVGHPPTRGAWL